MKALKFDGTGSEYFKIWIVNILLVIVTFGLYYPWAKVRTHRYFYGNMTLVGKNFEYHATGKQLFLGFIISLILFIAYSVIQSISPKGSLILLGILFLAFPWLIWRSLKFSMRMTSFSNVRFGFAGGLGASYINFLVFPILFLLAIYVIPGIGAAVLVPALSVKIEAPSWLAALVPLLIIVSLSFALYFSAYMKKRNTSYIINSSRYGQGQFATSLETKKFLGIAFKTLLLALFVMGAIALVVGGILYATIGLDALMELKNNMSNPKTSAQNMGAMVPVILTIYGGMILGAIPILAYNMTRQRTYIYANTTLDDTITFASTLKAKSLAWVIITNFLAVLLTLGFASPWTKVRIARLMAENTLVDAEDGFSTYMTQKEKEESSLGEQIGDAFDVDVGLGF